MDFSLLSPLEFFVDPKNGDGRNNKPPAMRVRVEGSALASKRRQSGYDTGVQVVSARKGGRFGKQGTQPVAHEVDVQVPHRVHTEV